VMGWMQRDKLALLAFLFPSQLVRAWAELF